MRAETGQPGATFQHPSARLPKVARDRSFPAMFLHALSSLTMNLTGAINMEMWHSCNRISLFCLPHFLFSSHAFSSFGSCFKKIHRRYFNLLEMLTTLHV